MEAEYERDTKATRTKSTAFIMMVAEERECNKEKKREGNHAREKLAYRTGFPCAPNWKPRGEQHNIHIFIIVNHPQAQQSQITNTMAAAPFESWYKNLPVVTKTYMTASVGTTLAVYLEVITPLDLYLNFHQIIHQYHVNEMNNP